jgi:cytochrome c peroxidase
MKHRLPIPIPLPIPFSTCAALTAALLLTCVDSRLLGADANVSVNARLQRTLTGVRIDIQQNADAHSYWRVDAATALSAWLPAGRFEVVNSNATVNLDVPANPTPGQSFYRLIADNSVENVLNLPPSPFNYSNITLPPHLLTPDVNGSDNTPANNPVTDAGATLGRVLFYDRNLSRNRTIACASCHLQANGFSDPGQFSRGFEGGFTGRNSMGLANAKFYDSGRFFWDERAATLEDQVLMPIQDGVEMGMDLVTLTNRLQGYQYYRDLFTTTFGDDQVTADRISRALAQFVRSMLSFNSRFDQGQANNFANFTATEALGRQIFNSGRASCSRCHEGANLVGDQMLNNGLESPFVDLGEGGANGNANDNGKFKMSSLRNIEKTAPYMHDGRFATLEAVVDFYSTDVVDNPNLSGRLRPNGAVRRPNFTVAEKAALVAYMKTFTDNDFMADPKYSSPFR